MNTIENAITEDKTIEQVLQELSTDIDTVVAKAKEQLSTIQKHIEVTAVKSTKPKNVSAFLKDLVGQTYTTKHGILTFKEGTTSRITRILKQKGVVEFKDFENISIEELFVISGPNELFVKLLERVIDDDLCFLDSLDRAVAFTKGKPSESWVRDFKKRMLAKRKEILEDVPNRLKHVRNYRASLMNTIAKFKHAS